MIRPTQHNQAPCLVVGRSVAALYRAAVLQQSTFTILLTPADISVDRNDE